MRACFCMLVFAVLLLPACFVCLVLLDCISFVALACLHACFLACLLTYLLACFCLLPFVCLLWLAYLLACLLLLAFFCLLAFACLLLLAFKFVFNSKCHRVSSLRLLLVVESALQILFELFGVFAPV